MLFLFISFYKFKIALYKYSCCLISHKFNVNFYKLKVQYGKREERKVGSNIQVSKIYVVVGSLNIVDFWSAFIIIWWKFQIRNQQYSRLQLQHKFWRLEYWSPRYFLLSFNIELSIYKNLFYINLFLCSDIFINISMK